MTIEEYLVKSNSYEETGDYSGMFSVLAEGIRMYPFGYELYYSLGFYYLSQGMTDCAYLCFENALQFCNVSKDAEEIRNTMDELKEQNDVSVKKTAIIIVSYNLLEAQKKSIETIRKLLYQGTYRIIVVDNASTDGICEWLEKQEDIELIKNNENKGFSVACNQGAGLVTDEDIFLLNNDAFLTPNALFWLKMGLYSSTDVGATGAVSNAAGNEQQIDVTCDTLEEYCNFGEKRNVPMQYPYEERVRLSGFGMLIKSSLWKECGGMDEAFSPGYFEDDDISMKIRGLGYRMLLCKNSFVYHIGSQSFSKKVGMNDILLRNYYRFNEKYGFNIIKVAYPLYDLIGRIPFKKEDEFCILVLGYCLGANEMCIRERFPNAHIISVEKHREFLNWVRGKAVVYSDLNALKKDLQNPVFDVLLINSVGADAYTEEDLDIVSNLCRKNCTVIQ